MALSKIHVGPLSPISGQTLEGPLSLGNILPELQSVITHQNSEVRIEPTYKYSLIINTDVLDMNMTKFIYENNSYLQI